MIKPKPILAKFPAAGRIPAGRVPHMAFWRTAAVWSFALVFVAPVVWLVAASFSRAPLSGDLIGSGWTLDNYRGLIRESSLTRWMLTSVFVCGMQTVMTVFLCSLGGFALAKYRFRGRRMMMALMLGTLLLPAQVLLPSAWNVVRMTGLLDSYLAIILPGGVSVFGLFLCKQSISLIPDDLLAAGRMDGCSEWRLWWEIVLPVIRPTTSVFALLTFVSSWNSFLWPQIVLMEERKHTLSIGLANLAGLSQASPGPLLAAAVIGVLPVAGFFLCIHRDFMSGMAAGAVKG